MLKNYIKVAWRNLLNSKFYSAINILGLTVGLSVGILILIWVQDEWSYDTFNTKLNRIYKVNTTIGSGESKQVWGSTSGPVAYHASKDVPGVEQAVRVVGNYLYTDFKYNDKQLKSEYGSLFVDDNFFFVFDYRLLKGDLTKPFSNAMSVILTESVSKKYFGSDSPIGKTISSDKELFTVSGVIADFPANSSIRADMLFSMELRKKQYNGNDKWKSLDQDWGNYYADTYLLVTPNANTKAIGNKLTQIHMKMHTGIKATDGVFSLQPMADIHLYNPDGTSAGAQMVKIFCIVAALILIIACINYVNMSTARAILRSKEVSLRKIIGAGRGQLFVQFIFETTLYFALATALSFLLIYLLMPFYNNLSGKLMYFDLTNLGLWKVIALTIAGTLIASSVYPAILLSSFKPINALKGTISGASNAVFRKVLVVCQFTFSISLIIGTLVINRQLDFIRSKQLGYNRQHVFTVTLDWMQGNYEAIKADLLTNPEIKAVATGYGSVVSSNGSTGDTDWDGKNPNMTFIMNVFQGDKSFIDLFEIKLAAGANFRGEKADSTHFILSETAIKQAGIKNPIGKRFKLFNIDGTIIGVVKDFHFGSLKQVTQPAAIMYNKVSSQLFVKTTGAGAGKAIKAVEKHFKQYNTAIPFSYHFVDEDFNDLYRVEQRTSTLFNIFAGIAIFISCLGLFGLATYTAQVRVKEIGIRKVLGASITTITAMLSKDFLRLVVIAFFIASPITWYLMNQWLMAYAYRASVNGWVLVVAGATAMFIALITISFQSVKAALANPVKSLRNE